MKIVLGAIAENTEVPEFDIFNPCEEMARQGMGTIAFRDSWDIFDQIMMTEFAIKPDFSMFMFWKSGIFNRPFLVQTSGQ